MAMTTHDEMVEEFEDVGPAVLLLVTREFWVELVAVAEAEGVKPGELLETALREHVERKSFPGRC